ncbi:hypothetical protein MFIFM68171_08968 [Madurella fahalii]|uniref:F-box domain-containing protein n=1 Tax=Madurella fahalii TaxID=1157608 RepID=A0ABQ0GLX3_9PEZI
MTIPTHKQRSDTTMLLTQLPPEIIHSILSYVELDDLTTIPLICRFFNGYVKDNSALYRAIYLRLLDEPQKGSGLDFSQEIRDLIHLKALCSPDSAAKPSQIDFVHRTVTRLLKHSLTAAGVAKGDGDDGHNNVPKRTTRSLTFPPSRNAAFLTALFSSSRPARAKFMSRSGLYERCRSLMAVEAEAEAEAGAEAGPTARGSAPGLASQSEPARGPRDEAESEGDDRRQYRYRMLRLRRLRQLSAKLHCLYGCGVAGDGVGVVAGDGDGDGDGDEGSGCHREEAEVELDGFGEVYTAGLYPLACSKVYDMREHTPRTRWGPFLDRGAGAASNHDDDEEEEEDEDEDEDGQGGLRVDWEKVEAIIVVLATNMWRKGLDRFPIFRELWARPFAGVWPGSYVPFWGTGVAEPKLGELERMDPYGVSGSWLRVICFLDYGDFFDFNFPAVDDTPDDVPRPPLCVGEATRLILMKMRVTKIEPPSGGDHKGYPVVHFQGFSRALDGFWNGNTDSDLRGTVRMTPEGEVRWTSYSIFSGESRWKTEGIQLGGIRSARGVVGYWFDKDYNPQGPLGPTAFWKVSDREPKLLADGLLSVIADDADWEEDSYDEFEEEALLPSDLSLLGVGYEDDDDDDDDDDEDGDGVHVHVWGDQGEHWDNDAEVSG